MKKYNFYKQNVDFSCCSKLIWIEAHVSDRIKIQQGNFDFYISKYRLFSRNSEMQTQTSEKKSGLQDINSQFWEEKSELRDINSEFKSRNPDYFSEFISCDLKKKNLRILILYLAILRFWLFPSIQILFLAIPTFFWEFWFYISQFRLFSSYSECTSRNPDYFSEFWIYILRFLLFFPQNKTS